ncbi:hypothetical protein DFP97_1112 [Paenibacillus prosopidis]|uniref:Uncharacterized protein n=1 Tax=Paenibacillus prosopidis TaxID=630520 RepID=A0A368VS25_9BACL|nr:hypothetical protein DFP97_1112 [Paenibacillus prosopidis]
MISVLSKSARAAFAWAFSLSERIRFIYRNLYENEFCIFDYFVKFYNLQSFFANDILFLVASETHTKTE